MNKKVYLSKELIESFSKKTLYRMLIKNIKLYKSKNTILLYKDIKSDFIENRNLTNEKLINIELRKARVGLGHILMYNEKTNELRDNYTTTKADYEPLNPKDENYIYF